MCYSLEQNTSYAKAKNAITDKNCLDMKEYIINKNSIKQNCPSQLCEDFVIKTSNDFEITCIEFAPKIFSLLRELDHVSEDDLIFSFLPMKNQETIKKSEGRSGNFFLNSFDKQYILKTISSQDVEIIRRKLLNKMANHFIEHKDSLIGRIYGLYKIKIKTGIFSEDEIHFVLMKNVFGIFNRNLLAKYDLKGSALNRKIEINSENIEQDVMKDINFFEIEKRLFLNEINRKKLINIVANDVSLFSTLGIMDYSLLVVKLNFNVDEVAELFGNLHIEKTEEEVRKILNDTKESKVKQHNEAIKGNNNYKVNIDKLRFERNHVGNLKKYLFPSLYYDKGYIISIIDFFQSYDLNKKLETKLKGIKADLKDISSMPPDDYVVRFINNMTIITNGIQLLKESASSSSE